MSFKVIFFISKSKFYGLKILRLAKGVVESFLTTTTTSSTTPTSTAQKCVT